MTACRALVALLVVAAVAAGAFLIGRHSGGNSQPAPTVFGDAKEPPPEYLYLDTARVLAYLGQIEGGLTSDERRSFQQTDEVGGGVSASGVDVSAKRQRVGSVQQDVTAGTTDRFYHLLALLKDPPEDAPRWLYTINAHLHGRHTTFAVIRTLRRLRVGDFVRITRARAYLAPYAAVYRKTSYSLNYLGGDLTRPQHALFTRISREARRAVACYRKAVGPNPRIPIVVPALNRRRTTPDPVEFIVPVRRDGLTSEPSSLAGEMTIVGKVIYLDPRRASHVSHKDPNPPIWVDHETVHTFAPALEHAQAALLRLLGLAPYEGRRKQLGTVVRRSVTFSAPLAVVLPIAIYQ